MVIDRCSKVCDRRKASLNGHHDCRYLDVTTTFTNFNSLTIFSKTILPCFKKTNQIYDEGIAQTATHMEIVSKNLTF